MTTLLACMPHAQAKVVHNEDGSHHLISYQTRVASITADGWLTVEGWQSPTTRRHIAAFIDEYVYGLKSKAEQSRSDTESYQTAKALYEGRMKMYTIGERRGEVVDL